MISKIIKKVRKRIMSLKCVDVSSWNGEIDWIRSEKQELSMQS